MIQSLDVMHHCVVNGLTGHLLTSLATNCHYAILSNFGTFYKSSIMHAQRESGLFLCDLLDLRDQASVLSNGMSLLRSEIDDLISFACCT